MTTEQEMGALFKIEHDAEITRLQEKHQRDVFSIRSEFEAHKKHNESSSLTEIARIRTEVRVYSGPPKMLINLCSLVRAPDQAY